MVAAFAVGDLVKVVNCCTTGFEYGEVGVITKSERMNGKHYIYWVLFGKEKQEVPMWHIEIEKIA